MLEALIALALAFSPHGPWAPPVAGPREPQACPASSSRAGWPSRVLRRADGTYVKLFGRRPRLAEVTARGHLLRQRELGARRTAEARALACGRGGRIAAAWTDGTRLWLSTDGRPARVLDRAAAIGDVALAYDGARLRVIYAVPGAVRAATADGRITRLGPASEVTRLAAERDVVAWTTIDAGEERNERRRVYAVRGSGRAHLVHRARRVYSSAMTAGPGVALRLAVAPDGRAALLFGLDADEFGDTHTVWAARAGAGGRFGKARRLADDGEPGDVAIGAEPLFVYTTPEGLLARLGSGPPETVVAGPASQPRASFAGGRARVEWRGAASTRAAS